MDELGSIGIESKATYAQIKEYILENLILKVLARLHRLMKCMREHDNQSKGEMKTMKKHLGIALVLITILSLTACGSNKKIVLPKAEEVKEIEIMQNTSEESLKIENQDEIFGIIADIEENTKDTGKESVNDQPTNIKDYIIVKFHHKNAEESPRVVYVYKDKNSRYVEQPYVGIWKLREETFDRISSNLIK
ncbi:hypothetical protein HMPREF1863_01092 [Aedoeadaptatus coxii]|uniref:DUF5301 domain-containing protein n=1 Tax=Aedoeadaptatus coxii TaxID=755172 RepID=A0A134AF78_9FIRM|nr:DUF5301 domain-containing protein [Peptoniphilus coxii]KXB66386.1 hypothetical protein HMPREF1863_01092 [Peptoniphilus coxii]